MRKLIAALLFFAMLCPVVQCQESNQTPPVVKTKVIRRINIRHADPYLIMLLLKGGYITQVEYSTIMKLNNRGG